MKKYLVLLFLLALPLHAQRSSPDGGEIEGSIAFAMHGPGAAPFGWASALAVAHTFPVNLGRLMRLQEPAQGLLPADEFYDADATFTLRPYAKDEWRLKELRIRYEFIDRTRFGDAIRDAMNDSGTVTWSDGAWRGPAGWHPPDPEIDLKVLEPGGCKPASTAAAAAGAGASADARCYELKVKIFHPMLPTGRSEMVMQPLATAAMNAKNGDVAFEFDPMEIPDLSPVMPTREEGRQAMIDLLNLVIDGMERLTGYRHPIPAEWAVDQMDLPDMKQNARFMSEAPRLLEKAFEAVRLEPDPVGFSWDQTYSGRLENWVASDQDTMTTLTGAQAYYEFKVPVFQAVLEKTDPQWVPEEPEFMTTVVRTRLDGDQSPVMWRFTLFDVTSETGTCLNSDDQGVGPDLEFDDGANDGMFTPARQVGKNEWQIETREPQSRPTVVVRATDYGAWGKLRAEAKYGEEWVPAAVEDFDKPYVTIPWDEEGGENRIADAWERRNDITPGTDPRSDDDAEPANGKVGDGLTLYEEYRGFEARGGQWKADPRRKELLVAPGAGIGYEHLAFFERLSGIKVMLLTRSELGDSRVVNRNANPAANRVEQHGLWIHMGPLPDLTAGVSKGAPGTPGEVTEIIISDKLGEDEIPGTIAHELLHGLDVDHHGRGDGRAAVWSDDQGRLYPAPPPGKNVESVRVQAAVRRGEASGNQKCVMAYPADVFYLRDQSLATERDGSLTPFRLPPDINSLICHSHLGTDFNAGGKQAGNAWSFRGNCWARMTVSDEK